MPDTVLSSRDKMVWKSKRPPSLNNFIYYYEEKSINLRITFMNIQVYTIVNDLHERCMIHDNSKRNLATLWSLEKDSLKYVMLKLICFRWLGVN